MSRADSSAFLVALALSLVAMPAWADPSRRAPPGQGLVAVPVAAPSTVGRTHLHHPGPVPLAQPTARFFTEPVWRSEVTVVHQARAEPAPRPIRPRSGNPVEPGAVVSRTPSGRVVIGLPPGFILPAVPGPAEVAQSRPHAPPQFHIIGAPSSRHMGAPVRLTHGVKPPETLQTGPKVVWLDRAGVDDAGGRVKRLR